jgi:hypothetical protein
MTSCAFPNAWEPARLLPERLDQLGLRDVAAAVDTQLSRAGITGRPS